MKSTFVKDGLYRKGFWICWDCTSKEAILFINKKIGKYLKKNGDGPFEDTNKDNLALGMTYCTSDEKYVIIHFGEKIIKKSTVEHEVLHLCFSVFRCIQLPINEHTEEAFNYYFEYIKRKITKAIKNKKSVKQIK